MKVLREELCITAGVLGSCFAIASKMGSLGSVDAIRQRATCGLGSRKRRAARRGVIDETDLDSEDEKARQNMAEASSRLFGGLHIGEYAREGT